MAGDTPKGFERAADAQKSLSEATSQSVKATEAQTAAMGPNLRALDNFTQQTAAATRQQQTLAQTIQEQNRRLMEQARGIGSLASQYASLTQGIGGFLGNMSRMISIGGIYNQLLDEMRTGQKAFTASLAASTSEVGKATANADKMLFAYRNTMADAHKIAGELKIDFDELKGISKALVGQFASQILATGKATETTKALQREVVSFSRFMGTDYNATIGLIDTRMQGSTKTLGEVRKELLSVAMEADKWTDAIKKMGDRAQRTGNVTRQQFLAVIKGIGQEFKGGMFAAEGFAKSTRNIMDVAKRAGLTAEEQKGVAAGFGKIISQMGSFNTIFGARTGQYFASLLSDLSQIQDAALRKRFEPYAKRFMETGQLNVLDLRALVDISRGSREGVKILTKVMGETARSSPEVMRSVLAETLGPGQQYQADILNKMFINGKLERAFTETDAARKDSGQKTQMELFKERFDALIKAGHTTGSLAHAAAAKAYELQQKIYAWLRKSPILFALAIAGAQALGGLLARGLGALGTRLIGGLGARLAAGGGRLAGLGARMATWAAPAAAGVAGTAGTAATAAGAAGTAGAGAGGAAATGGLMAKAGVLGGAAIKTAGAAVAAYVGYKAGKMLDKYGGRLVASAVSESRRVAMGKDVSVSGAIGTLAIPSRMLKQFVRIRGVLTEGDKKAYDQREKLIKEGRRNWNKLNAFQKQQVKQLENTNAGMKRWVKKMTLSKKEAAAYDKEYRRAQLQDMTQAFEKMDLEKISKMSGRGRAEEAVGQFIAQSGSRLRKGTGAALDRFLKTEAGQRVVGVSGLSQEQFKMEVIKKIASQKFFMGEDPLKKSAKQQGEYVAEIQKWLKSGLGQAASPEMKAEAMSWIAKLKEAQAKSAMQGIRVQVESGEGEAEEGTVKIDSADKVTVTGKTSVKFDLKPIATRAQTINTRNRPKGATG